MLALPRWLVLLIGIGVTVTLFICISVIIGRVFVRRSIRRLIESIGKEQLPNFSAALCNNLPPPVARYLTWAIGEGHPNIRYAIIKQRAKFRNRPGGPWTHVKAREVLSGMEPAFVWDATLRHSRLWWKTAKLGFVNGSGSGHVKAYGSIVLQDLGGPETDASMLFRFLSELVWLPTGLVPTRTLRWEPINDKTARAVIKDGNLMVSATYHFGDEGQVERIVTDDKFRDLKSGFARSRFTMICRDYQDVDGVKIPLEVDFVWNLEEGDFEYGRFRIDDVRFYY